MDVIAPGLALAPLDSARVVSTVYSLSLVTLVPFVAAAMAAVMLRGMPAGTRVLVWRAAVVALLVIAAAQLVPVRWEAWVLPAVLADPLIVLGRQAVRSGIAPSDPSALYATGGTPASAVAVALLCTAYVAGVISVLATGAWSIAAARRVAARATLLDDATWRAVAGEVRKELGILRTVPLLTSAGVQVPMTVGVWRPVVLIPAALVEIPRRDRRAVLLHELAHVRAADVAYAIAAHVACALFWFHPGAWWVTRGLRKESEMACDDCVLGHGTRQSDYAALLVRVADRLHAASAHGIMVPLARGASAITGQGTLRARLAAITAPGVDRTTPSTAWVRLAIAASIAVAGPLGVMQLEPTRDVLQSLMADSRWESRAYAALGLAPRPDSLAVTQRAAASDPSPHVRAWASYALSRHTPTGRNGARAATHLRD